MADIYYSDGSVGIGTMARSDDNFNFDPVLDISGTRGALTLRATIDDGLTTLRFKGARRHPRRRLAHKHASGGCEFLDDRAQSEHEWSSYDTYQQR
jgi:hypothetical protein